MANVFTSIWKYILEILKKITNTTTTGTTTDTTTTNAPPTCGCNINAPLVEPEKGQECPVPWGKDVRFLGWSESKGDWVFIGFDPQSATISGEMITGHCFVKNGIRYHYKGYRTPTSNSPFKAEATGKYQTTYRLYFDPRKA